MADRRDQLIQAFVKRPLSPVKRNLIPKRGFGVAPSSIPRKLHGGTRITEDDPRWNARTMGDKTGYHKGRWYSKGKKVPFDMRGQ